MFSVAFGLVILSGLLHAVWNLFAKRSGNPVVFLWSFQWVAVLAFLPWALTAMVRHAIPIRGWEFLGVTVVLHGIYVMLLARTYRAGDLSHVYPLMRGVSPLLVPILGISFLGEHLSGMGWVSIVGIVAGVGLLGNWRWHRHPGRSARPPTATRLAVAVGLAITAYTVLDKVTLQYLPAVTLNEASNLGNLIALSWWAVRSGEIRAQWTHHWPTIVLGGIVSPGAYLLFLLALRMGPVAQLAPIRAIGTVFGTLLGIRVLKEPQGSRRMVAAGLITAGVIALGIWG